MTVTSRKAAKRGTRLLKVLVASAGSGAGDYAWTDEGEVVIFNPMVCDSTSGRCGCDRAFVGLRSRKSTTVAKVASRDFTDAEIDELVAGFVDDDGFLTAADVREMFDIAVEVASGYPDSTASLRAQAVNDAMGTEWEIRAEVPEWFANLSAGEGAVFVDGGSREKAVR
jgi:hypothetical protein